MKAARGLGVGGGSTQVSARVGDAFIGCKMHVSVAHGVRLTREK